MSNRDPHGAADAERVATRSRIKVQPAAANTSTFETMTGLDAMSTPKAIHRAEPSICKPRSIVGFEKKYEATKTAVAIQPTVSAIGRLDRLIERSPFGTRPSSWGLHADARWLGSGGGLQSTGDQHR